MMKKRSRTDHDQAVVNVCKRELGQLSTRDFAHRLAASEDLVLRLEIHKKLEKHEGCVNTLSFNSGGDVLISGSDDLRVILWDWETGRVKLSFNSGHRNNVFQAKFMPFSDDRTIVTCAADGEIRQAQILEGGEVKTILLGKHKDSRVHKLAIEPGSPHIFYSCGEDGVVQHFDLRTRSATELFTCRSINDPRNFQPYVHLNAIAIDPRNPNLFAVGGMDEFARLYDIRKYNWDGSSDFGQPADYFCPQHLIGNGDTGITGLSFSDQSELLVSYNNEFIYLFTRDMGLGNPPFPSFSSPISMGSDTSEVEPGSIASSSSLDVDGKNAAQAYKGHRNCETVKGVSFFGPRCEYVSSGSDCGRIFIWKKRGGELIRVMEADRDVVNCTEPHPHTMALASSGIDSDIKIWTPKAIERATLPTDIGQVLMRDCYWFGMSDSDDNDYFSDDEDDDDEEDSDDVDIDEDSDDADNDDDSDDDCNDDGCDCDDVLGSYDDC
ncbi:DDB1- and CUL4-associated factor 8-like isoform X2 [Populus alba x Populus x berolinensis]|nr:DDB1- and CUL4-associated factor 8-like isoform X2 [Populus alba x Populus x berolinensis]